MKVESDNGGSISEYVNEKAKGNIRPLNNT